MMTSENDEIQNGRAQTSDFSILDFSSFLQDICSKMFFFQESCKCRDPLPVLIALTATIWQELAEDVDKGIVNAFKTQFKLIHF